MISQQLHDLTARSEARPIWRSVVAQKPQVWTASCLMRLPFIHDSIPAPDGGQDRPQSMDARSPSAHPAEHAPNPAHRMLFAPALIATAHPLSRALSDTRQKRDYSLFPRSNPRLGEIMLQMLDAPQRHHALPLRRTPRERLLRLIGRVDMRVECY